MRRTYRKEPWPGRAAEGDLARRKLLKVGGCLALPIPPAFVAELCVEPGDSLFILKTDDGLLITNSDPLIEWKIERSEHVVRQARTALQRMLRTAVEED